MEELLIILIVLGIVLTVVTLVGHGIWVAVAWLFGAATSRPRQVPERTAAACPRCGSALGVGGDFCGVCDWPGALPTDVRRRAALMQLRTQLARFAAIGAIDEATREQLAAAIGTHLAKPIARAEAESPAGIEFVEAELVDAEIVAAEAVPHEPVAAPPPPTESSTPDVAERVRRYAVGAKPPAATKSTLRHRRCRVAARRCRASCPLSWKSGTSAGASWSAEC